jgi:hypothetical protein
MKYFMKISTLALIGVSLLSSCSKQFLDLKPPSEIPTADAITDENSMQTAVIGMYASLRAVDFFGRSIPLDGDLLADNVYIDPSNNSNRYIQEFTYTYIPLTGDVQNTWAEAYNTILRANNIINADIASSPKSDQLKGEALTIRALAYFELLKFYAKPFQTDPGSPGVPLVLTYNAFLKPARNTVAEGYAQIESDLKQAYVLMTEEKNSSYITKYAAGALLARLYQFKGDWAKARDAALDVVHNGGYGLTDSASLATYWSNPYPVSNKVETIFEVEFDIIGNNSTDDLDAFYDQAGYGDALCTDDLYNAYSASDARKNLIYQGTRGGQNVLVVNKYPNTTNANGKDNTKIIRYAEVLLILAESYANTGDEPDALDVLNFLAQKRDTHFGGYASGGPGLINDIYLERRRELAFEGHRYWDLVRLNRDVVRDPSTGNYASYVPLTLPAGSNRRIFPIPQAEINTNKNMKQNPGYN